MVVGGGECGSVLFMGFVMVLYGCCLFSIFLFAKMWFFLRMFFFTFLLLHSFGSLVFSFQLILSCSCRTPKHSKRELSFPIFSKFFYNSFQYKFNYNSFSFNITNCLKLQKNVKLKRREKKIPTKTVYEQQNKIVALFMFYLSMYFYEIPNNFVFCFILRLFLVFFSR